MSSAVKLNSILSSIATLEVDRKSDLNTFLHTPGAPGGTPEARKVNGVGITNARRILEGLGQDPPDDTDADARGLWVQAWSRCSAITNG